MKIVHNILLLCIFASITSHAQTMDIPTNLSGEVWKLVCPPNTICKNTTYTFLDNNRFEMNEWFSGSNFGYISAKGHYRFYPTTNEIYFIVDNVSTDNKPSTNNELIKKKWSSSFKIIQKESDSIYSVEKFSSIDTDGINGKRMTTREVFPIQKMMRTKPPIDITANLSGEVWQLVYSNPKVQSTTYSFFDNNKFEMNEWYNGSGYYGVKAKGTYLFVPKTNEIFFKVKDFWRNDQLQMNNKQQYNHGFKIIQKESDSIYSVGKFSSKDVDSFNVKRMTTNGEVLFTPIQKMKRTKLNKVDITANLSGEVWQFNIDRIIAKETYSFTFLDDGKYKMHCFYSGGSVYNYDEAGTYNYIPETNEVVFKVDSISINNKLQLESNLYDNVIKITKRVNDTEYNISFSRKYRQDETGNSVAQDGLIDKLYTVSKMMRTKPPIDITENLSGEIWKTPNEDFVLQFFDNGVYEIKEKYEYSSERTRKTSIGYGIHTAIIKGTYKVDVNTGTIFLNKNRESVNENGVVPNRIFVDENKSDDDHIYSTFRGYIPIRDKDPENYVVPITKIKIDEKKLDDTYLATFFGDYTKSYGKAPEKPIAETEPSSLGQKQLIRIKETQQQKIDKLLWKLTSINLENLDSWGRDELDIYERPYVHPNLRRIDRIAVRIDSLKNQLYQLGVTVIWNWTEKKRGYELETNQHLIARRQFVEVYVDKTLYQSEKAPNDYFLKFSIKNTGKQNIGFNLSHPNNIFYANQWGIYTQPYRGAIDEKRIVFTYENLQQLKEQYYNGVLQIIKPNKQLDYYINLEGGNNKMVLDDKNGFFIVTIDGQMKFTDGKEAELITLEKSDDEVQRAIVFPLPATIKNVPEKQLMFIDKTIKENRH